MKRFLTLCFLLLVMGGIDYGLLHYDVNQWIFAGPFILLFLFLYLKPRLKCGNCGYPVLKNSSGAWVIRARKNCSNCDAELKPFGTDSFFSGPREFWGLSLQMMSALGALFSLAVIGSLFFKSNGLTKIDLFVVAIIGIPILLLSIGAWILGSKLLKPKSK